MTDYNTHQPVMLDEVLSFVPRKKPIVYLDLTLGRAGHAKAILDILPKKSTLIGVDKDQDALDYCQSALKPYETTMTIRLVHSPFSTAVSKLKDASYHGADFILMDIGVSSPQFDDPRRGFSYRFDAPLDMRMDQSQSLTAQKLLAEADEKELVHIFRDLGECHVYYPTVKAILRARQVKPITTTFELVDIIKSSLPAKELNQPGHPAKQFFLGLRYEVNKEMDELRLGLSEAIRFLNPEGRLVIISFNSEEDKIVKDTFKTFANPAHSDKYHPLLNEQAPGYVALTKKPLVPSEKEIEENNRAKSSILRAIERRSL
ncbi:MAG: 16S rRNA (cytosine(1402)-N(4))-methyltransferase RsmH [Bacilli bacterium]|jgi:16S rRNA (cytosine1402-N4)-methyltransferase|nr:16S rRNA (cytosine(1402)-N(4))-methyltransferase RsmH [Bacilli bacterium]